jgi:hypothetical protein
MIGIYKIINQINKDCYIGSSLDFNSRKSRHFRDLKDKKHHSIILQRAVEKYGINNFQFEIIENCEKEMLLEREQYYIDLINPKYNICKIAGSPLGTKQSEKACEKKRKYALENNVIPPESTWKDKQKKVYMLEYNTLEILQEFISLSEACRFIGKDATFASTITSCCLNKRFSAYNYRWVFNIDDIQNLREKEIKEPWNKGKKIDNKQSKKVYQYSLELVFIKEWDSVKHAEEGIGKKGISNCALGKSKSSNGYIWKYEKI